MREKVVLNYIFLLTELLDNLAASLPATEGELGVGGSREEESDGADQSPVETGTRTSSGFFYSSRLGLVCLEVHGKSHGSFFATAGSKKGLFSILASRVLA